MTINRERELRWFYGPRETKGFGNRVKRASRAITARPVDFFKDFPPDWNFAIVLSVLLIVDFRFALEFSELMLFDETVDW